MGMISFKNRHKKMSVEQAKKNAEKFLEEEKNTIKTIINSNKREVKEEEVLEVLDKLEKANEKVEEVKKEVEVKPEPEVKPKKKRKPRKKKETTK